MAARLCRGARVQSATDPAWGFGAIQLAQIHRRRSFIFAVFIAAHAACGLVSHVLGFGAGGMVAVAVEPLAAWSAGYVALLVVSRWLPERDIRTQIQIFAALSAVLTLGGIVLLSVTTQDMPASSALVALSELPALLLQVAMPPLLIVLVASGARMAGAADGEPVEDALTAAADGLGVAALFICLVVALGMVLA